METVELTAIYINANTKEISFRDDKDILINVDNSKVYLSQTLKNDWEFISDICAKCKELRHNYMYHGILVTSNRSMGAEIKEGETVEQLKRADRLVRTFNRPEHEKRDGIEICPEFKNVDVQIVDKGIYFRYGKPTKTIRRGLMSFAKEYNDKENVR